MAASTVREKVPPTTRSTALQRLRSAAARAQYTTTKTKGNGQYQLAKKDAKHALCLAGIQAAEAGAVVRDIDDHQRMKRDAKP